MDNVKFYRIENGPVRIGPDHDMVLAGDEFDRRSHRMAVLEEKEGFRLARPNEGIDFKTGEIVGLTKDPDKQFASNFVAIDGGEAKNHWDEYNAKVREREDRKQREMERRAAAIPAARVPPAPAAQVKAAQPKVSVGKKAADHG